MKVRLLTSRGLANGASETWGETIDVPSDEAKRLIDAGQAEPIGKPKPEPKD